jgi:hypothetical protein
MASLGRESLLNGWAEKLQHLLEPKFVLMTLPHHLEMKHCPLTLKSGLRSKVRPKAFEVVVEVVV